MQKNDLSFFPVYQNQKHTVRAVKTKKRHKNGKNDVSGCEQVTLEQMHCHKVSSHLKEKNNHQH